MTKLILSIAFLMTNFERVNSSIDHGIVYFSYDNGKTWENKSKGLPTDIFLSDIAAGDEILGLTTKKNGIFIFDHRAEAWIRLKTSPIESDEINALYYDKTKIIVGTKQSGIFNSLDKGESWIAVNEGLKNLTIRKIIVIDNRLYTGTNGGLYFFDEFSNRWHPEYGHDQLQVNGIKALDGEIYIGTNQGAFKKKNGEWIQIMPNRSLYNISTDGKNIYALTYSELFISADKGNSWQSDQKGLPSGMYSFQVIDKDQTVLAGQWDGVYVRTPSQGWKLSNQGLPFNFPVLELVVTQDMIIAGSSQWSK